MKRRQRKIVSSSESGSGSESTDTEIRAPVPPSARQANGRTRNNNATAERRGLVDVPLPSSDSSADEDLDSINSDHLFNPERERRPAPNALPRRAAQQPQSARQLNGARGRTPISASQPVGSARNAPPSGRFPPNSGTARPTPASQGSNQRRPTTAAAQPPKPFGGKEVRKKYSELIESCQGYEDEEGFDSNDLQKKITSNIKTGEELFHKIGGGPGDMLIAFLHTRMCSGMIKYKTGNIGSHTSAFKVDHFLESLMQKCISTSEADYKPDWAVRCISSSATDCCKTLPHLIALVGSFDREGLAPPKDKKARAPIRKKQFDETLAQATQHEEVQFDEVERTNRSKTNADNFSKEILKVLKQYNTPTHTTPVNLFEFTLDKTSFASTIESFFYVAFLIRDGDVCLYRQQPQGRTGKTDATLSIKADKPPEKDLIKDRERQKSKKEQLARRQFILSFSPKKWKALAAIATGEDVIAEHKRRVLGTSGTTSGTAATSKTKAKK